ncbi:MAG: hypothetical protein ACKO6J_09660 [Crocinitomicaceae bacterium]
MMKRFFILFGAALLSSCITQKNVHEVHYDQPYNGIVRFTNTPCKVNVEIISGNNNEYIGKMIYGINMDPRFQKNGLKLNFDFIPSKAPIPEGCTANFIATFTNISVIK